MNRKMNFTTTKNDSDDVVDDNYTELMYAKKQWVETIWSRNIYTCVNNRSTSIQISYICILKEIAITVIYE